MRMIWIMIDEDLDWGFGLLERWDGAWRGGGLVGMEFRGDWNDGDMNDGCGDDGERGSVDIGLVTGLVETG